MPGTFPRIEGPDVLDRPIRSRPGLLPIRLAAGIVVVLLLALALAGPVAAATTTIDPTEGDLTAALAAASSGDAIDFNPGGGTITLGSGLSVNGKDITILNTSGSTVTISSGSVARLITYDNGTLSLDGTSDLVLNSTYSGGTSYGIYSSGALTMDSIGSNSSITLTNSAGGYNSAWALTGTSITVNNGIAGTISATGPGAIGVNAGYYGNITINGGISGTISATAHSTNGATGLTGGQVIIDEITSTGSIQADGGTGATATGVYFTTALNGGDTSTPLVLNGEISAVSTGVKKKTYALSGYNLGAGISLNVTVNGTLKAVNPNSTNVYAIYVYSAATSATVTLGDGATVIGRIAVGPTPTAGNTLTLLGTPNAATSMPLILGFYTLTVGDGATAANWALAPTFASAFNTVDVKANAALSVNENVSIYGNITDNGALTFDLGGDTSYSHIISGSGSVTKTGTGTLTLSGTNDYTGATTVSQGTLKAGAANVFSTSSAMTVAAGATLDLNGYSQVIPSLSGAGSVTLGSASLTVNTTGSSTFSGAISGSGSLTKSGTGTLTLSGTSTYTGGTTISGGTLAASTWAGIGEGNYATVGLQHNLTFSGGTLTVGGTDVLTAGQTLNTGSAVVTFDTTSGDQTVAAALSGSGSVTKTGTGTLTLSRTNTYTGATTVSGGTLSISSADNLQGTSGVTLNGGTLESTASFSLGKNITLGASGGTIKTADSTTLTVSGEISGTGSLTKTGTGTLTLTADNTYTGATSIQEGTLRLTGSSASSSMSVSSGATLNFAPSRDLAYTGTITGAGHVTKTGTTTLTLSGDNSGFTGDLTLSGGTLSVSTGNNLGASSATLIFDGGTLSTTAAMTIAQTITASGSGTIADGGNALTLSGSLSGSGDLTLSGSGTETLDATFDGSGYSGTLTKSAGTLHLVTGEQLAGTLAIDDGATLDGVGSVGTLNLNGTISPGNSPGTITVTGDFTQGATGTYVCQLTPTETDLIAVTGSATLSGTLSIMPEYTTYTSGTVWTVLTATGGVSGTYSNVTYGGTPENWIFTPVYSADAVTVTLRRQSYSTPSKSSQSASVGSGLDKAAYTATGELAWLIQVLDASYGMTDAGLSSAQALARAIAANTSNSLTDYTLNVLSPELYDTFTQNVFETAHLLNDAQRAGLHEGEDGGSGQGFTNPLEIGPTSLAAQNNAHGPTLGLGTSGGGGSHSLSLGKFGVFIRTLGMRICQQASSDQTGSISLVGGITGGILYRPSPELIFGLAPGFVSQSTSMHSEGGGQGLVNDWSLGLLAGYRRGPFYADATIRGGYDTFRTSRALPLPSGSYTAKANWTGWNVNLSLGGGYDFMAGPFKFGPLAAVSWELLHEGSFSETGAGALNQSVKARNTSSLNTVVGGRLARTFETGIGDVTPELRAAWSAQWLGDSQNIEATFAGSPGSTYTARTKDRSYHSALVDVGLRMDLSESLSTTARFGVELFRPGYEAQAASLSIRYWF